MQNKVSRIYLRVISDFRRTVNAIFALCEAEFKIKEVGASSDWKRRLKVGQRIVSICNSVKTRALQRLAIPEAAVEQFWTELDRLDVAGYTEHLGEESPQKSRKHADGLYSLFARAVCNFYKRNSYFVGLSRRYAMPIFPNMSWKVQMMALAKAMTQHEANKGHLAVVGSDRRQQSVSSVWSPQFAEMLEESSLPERACTARTMYVLCGVHGGKETHGYEVAESLEYFRTQHFPLTLNEVLTLYTAHPNFLCENKHVLVLGQEYKGRYVALSYDERAARIELSFVSAEEADRSFAATNPHPSQFHGEPAAPTYAKPSAAVFLTISRDPS